METKFLSGETPRPILKKLNPLWWFGNDEAAADATFSYKYVRNPFQNFRWYVIGVVDSPHWVVGRAPLANQRSDFTPPEVGWCYSFIKVWSIPLLPYVSYSSSRLTWYVGWQPSGGFGVKLNFSNSAYN